MEIRPHLERRHKYSAHAISTELLRRPGWQPWPGKQIRVLFLHLKSTAHLRLGAFDEARRALEKLFGLTTEFSPAEYNAACLAAAEVGGKASMLLHLKRAVLLDSDWKNFAKADSDFVDYLTDPDWCGIVYS